MTEDEKNNGSENEQNKAEEPETAFKKVRFFDSFEEMNQYEYRQYANMSPDERLNTVLKIRKRVWPEESFSQSSHRHVYFKDDGDHF